MYCAVFNCSYPTVLPSEINLAFLFRLCTSQIEASTSPLPRATPWAFELLKIGLQSNSLPAGQKAVQMPHQLLLKDLSSKTNFVFNQTLFTLFRERELCRDDTFKFLLKTLLKELFTNKGEIENLSNLAKTEKTYSNIVPEQKINPVQIHHSAKATFKFPPSWAQCTFKCPGYARRGGC